MAKRYSIVSQETVTEFLPPNRTREREEVWARAKDSGVVFTTRIAPADYSQTHVELILNTLADYSNTLADQPGVVGVAMVQDVDANNQVATSWRVTVESASGDSTRDVRLTYGEGFDDRGYKKIAAAVATLDAIEGS
jgi:hypothetical protein